MGSLSDPPEERRVPPGIHPVVHQEEELHPQRQRRSHHGSLPKRGVKDPDLIKKMSRKQSRKDIKQGSFGISKSKLLEVKRELENDSLLPPYLLPSHQFAPPSP